jgi:hypothetical protein
LDLTEYDMLDYIPGTRKGGLTPQQIEAVRALAGCLPQDLVDFMAEGNEGEPLPRWVVPVSAGGNERFIIDISQFCDFTIPADELAYHVKYYSAAAGDGSPWLPVAESGEDVVCMSCRPGQHTVRLYETHSDRYSRGEVAPSFSDLVGRLTYHPQEKPWLAYMKNRDYRALEGWLAERKRPHSDVYPPIAYAVLLDDIELLKLCLQYGQRRDDGLGVAIPYKRAQCLSVLESWGGT